MSIARSKKIRRTAAVGLLMAISSVGTAAARIETSAADKPANRPMLRVLTATSTPLRAGHPVLFLGSQFGKSSRLEFPADQRYSKWSVIFENSVRIETVEVQVCEGTKPFADGVELFVDYNEKRLFLDGGRSSALFKVRSPARALTLGFLESPGVCLERIKIVTPAEFVLPRTISLNGKSKSDRDGEWEFAWENPLLVESLRLWNGSTVPGDAFTEHPRVRELEIRAGDAKPMRLELEDKRLAQKVELKESKLIRKIGLRALSFYKSSMNEPTPALGEVHLLAGGEPWIPVVLPDEAIEPAAVQRTKQLGYGDILDRELRVDERGELWRFRFRSDGTFFARVFVDRARVAKAWSAAGVWRIGEPVEVHDVPPAKMAVVASSALRAFRPKKAVSEETRDEEKHLSLVLSGVKIATADAVDSLPCATSCFSEAGERKPASQREFPVSEQIELQRYGRTLFFIRNRTPPAKQTMEFNDLRVRIHSLYD